MDSWCRCILVNSYWSAAVVMPACKSKWDPIVKTVIPREKHDIATKSHAGENHEIFDVPLNFWVNTNDVVLETLLTRPVRLEGNTKRNYCHNRGADPAKEHVRNAKVFFLFHHPWQGLWHITKQHLSVVMKDKKWKICEEFLKFILCYSIGQPSPKTLRS